MSPQHGAAQASWREYSIADAGNSNFRTASALLLKFNNVCGVFEFRKFGPEDVATPGLRLAHSRNAGACVYFKCAHRLKPVSGTQNRLKPGCQRV